MSSGPRLRTGSSHPLPFTRSRPLYLLQAPARTTARLQHCRPNMPRIIVPPSSGSSPPGVDSGQLGFYAPALAPFANQATVAMSNRAFFWRVVCPLSQTISKIGFSVVNAASVDDQCDVGIYNAACSQLLGSSGATSGKLTTTGAKTDPLLTPVALVAGQVYYAALSFGVIGGT